MINQPFPYLVTISREATSSTPFGEEGESFSIVYSGECDYENNRFPVIKDKVQVGRYNMYIPKRTLRVMKGDIIELTLPSDEIIHGVIVDYMPTNFGLTIKWDNINN